jgi:hypothetical protein
MSDLKVEAFRASVDVTGFWLMIPCSQVDGCKGFGGTHCLHLHGVSEDGRIFLQKIGILLLDYMVS